MSRAAKIARRTFLIGSAAIAGGVAFGLYAVRRPLENPLLANLADGEVSFNPWIRIGQKGITLIAPHTDLGQGARSVQAALIAEEMDIEFGQFDVEPGPPAAAYYNTASADNLVPFMTRDKSLLAESTRGIVGSVAKLMGAQGTGGSSTIADSWEKLRRAGAVARETLKLAAANQTGHAVEGLRTADAAVILPDGSTIPYTDLALAASKIDPVTDVVLREPSAWRLIGKPMQRLDIVGKSTGTLQYGIDLRMDGMLYATVRVNPRRGGALLSYDAGAAKTMPGVIHVLEVTNGVAVVADNTWNAFQAADAIVCDWGPAPYPPAMQDHWDAVSAAFTRDRLDREWRHDGDVPAAIAGADADLEAEYRAPYLAHAPLEPIGALVRIDEDRADIWVAHQMPRFAQDLVADLTGLDVDDVHLHNQYCGGSFGHRLEFDNVRYAVEVAVQLRGTPIKLTFSREEDFAHEYPRQIGMSRVSGNVSSGRIDMLDIAVASPSVIRSQLSRIGLPAVGPDSELAAGIWTVPYAIPNLRVRSYSVSGLVPTSSWRSVGASTGGFFMESAIDELILAAGVDPLEERLRMCNYEPARRVLETVGRLSDWGSDPGAGRGRGVALVISFGVPVAEVVEVSSTAGGIRIDKVFVAAEVGRIVDPVNFENQVQGAVVWGLGHAMNCELSYAEGKAEQTNYHVYQAMRLYQCPEIIVAGLENGGDIRGIGEPPVPPAAPALANAIHAATGKRLREMPFNKFIEFV